MGTLWRALLEGVGWHVGREAAKDALEATERALGPEAPPDPKALAAAQKARVKAVARAEKERAAAEKRAEREIEGELREMKKRVKR